MANFESVGSPVIAGGGWFPRGADRVREEEAGLWGSGPGVWTGSGSLIALTGVIH